MKITADTIPVLADESAHPASAVEWWFVQGYYEGARSGRRYFMLSLFRQNVAADPAHPENGFFLLLSVLDAATGRKENLSQVDPAVVGLFLRLAKGNRQADLDPRTVDALVDEIAAYGPPRPIRCEEAGVELRSAPFGVVWNEFSLCQSERAFHVALREPESRRHCRFRLQPLHSRMHIEDIEILDAKTTMAYVTYPCLDLAGEASGEKVSGQAWLDHQWGNMGWLVGQAAKRKVLGWEWFGINLDDGTDLLLMIHRDMKDQRVVTQYAAVLEDGRRARLCHDLTTSPARYWESQATHIRYPVAWRVEIPELELGLTYEPLADDQEIQVFGVIRAIWEGAGTVAGSLAGRPVAGRARLELQGYGYVFDFRQYQERWIRRIDRRIEEYLPKVIDEAQIQKYVGAAHWQHEPGVHTTMLSEPVWDLMSRKGKHWRPIFGILMLEALGVPSEPYEMLVSVVTELPHTGALIIDDIEDNSRIRRGEECIHLRYGVDVAINSANIAYFLPYLLLQDHPHLTEEQRLEIYRILSRQSVRSHFGQGQDIYWSKYMTPGNLTNWMNNSLGPKILQAYAYKTAALVQGGAEAACVIAKSDIATRRACARFARTFGVAFQIVDDVLDFSNSPRRRRPRGKDLAEGKLTYVICRALERLSPSQGRRLQSIICSGALRKDPSAIREGIELVRRSGALGWCQKEAQSMIDDQWRCLSEKLPPSEPKMTLRTLCSALLSIDDGSRERTTNHTG